jgi:hypothetical protein
LLQRGFNGDPSKVDQAVTAMIRFDRIVREQLLQQQLTAGPLAGQFAGPRFRYVV